VTTARQFGYFILLGLFWGISPSLYKQLSLTNVPLTHTIVYTGLGVGLVMFLIALYRDGWHGLDSRIPAYGAICAFLMNIPFAVNLFLASHVPPTELSIIITMSPFFSYLLALVTGTEKAGFTRLAAIAFGFLSTLVLILSREGMAQGEISWWLIASISVPVLYTFYNAYAARFWPVGANIMQAGAAESMCSGLLMLPVMLYMAPPGSPDGPALSAHWALVAATAMWVAERIAYFTLIKEKGAVYTVQATYVSTPAAVFIGALFFGGGTDIWLWVSLAILMLALWLNNLQRSSVTLAPTNPESHPG
jgi:drug/metabolite transporter (DMT)-like permease